MAEADIGIDLGTANILVYVKGKGIALKEPSVVAFDRESNQLVAIGEEARSMIGKTPEEITVVRPLRQGVISDSVVTEKMLEYFIHKVPTRNVFGKRPNINICVPSGASDVEKNAVINATYNAGARQVYLIEEPVAAAVGAGIDITKPCGNLVVDIGGGTTDIAVISLGNSVVSRSIKIAGDNFDEAIIRFIRKKHNVLIGERKAEELKINIGTLKEGEDLGSMQVTGRNLVTGLPKTITITSKDVRDAIKDCVREIIDMIYIVLEQTPPELSADISEQGILLTGGGALLHGIDEVIQESTGIETHIAEDPLTVVAEGTGKFVSFLESGATTAITKRKKGFWSWLKSIFS